MLKMKVRSIVALNSCETDSLRDHAGSQVGLEALTVVTIPRGDEAIGAASAKDAADDGDTVVPHTEGSEPLTATSRIQDKMERKRAAYVDQMGTCYPDINVLQLDNSLKSEEQRHDFTTIRRFISTVRPSFSSLSFVRIASLSNLEIRFKYVSNTFQIRRSSVGFSPGLITWGPSRS